MGLRKVSWNFYYYTLPTRNYVVAFLLNVNHMGTTARKHVICVCCFYELSMTILCMKPSINNSA